jgi:hypothetical protein
VKITITLTAAQVRVLREWPAGDDGEPLAEVGDAVFGGVRAGVPLDRLDALGLVRVRGLVGRRKCTLTPAGKRARRQAMKGART